MIQCTVIQLWVTKYSCSNITHMHGVSEKPEYCRFKVGNFLHLLGNIMLRFLLDLSNLNNKGNLNPCNNKLCLYSIPYKEHNVWTPHCHNWKTEFLTKGDELKGYSIKFGYEYGNKGKYLLHSNILLSMVHLTATIYTLFNIFGLRSIMLYYL